MEQEVAMKHLGLRISDELHAMLVDWARREKRSLHAQVMYLLQQACEAERLAAMKGGL
jgi:hypothetical protein